MSSTRLNYPHVYRDDNAFKTVHNYTLPQPYGWLEKDDTPEYSDFVDTQAAFTEDYLERNSKNIRERLQKSIESSFNFERVGTPKYNPVSNISTFSRNTGLQNQNVLYVTDGIAGDGMVNHPSSRILLDPNTFAADGTGHLAISSLSPNGRYLAYGKSFSGSDWVTAHIRDVSTCTDLSDELHDIKFSGLVWSGDSSGFFYSRYPSECTTGDKYLHDQCAYYHRVGTVQSDDVCVYADPAHPLWFVFAGMTDDYRYILLNVSSSASPENLIYLAPYNSDGHFPSKFIPLFGTTLECEYEYVTSLANDHNTMVFKTSKSAPKRKVIVVKYNPDDGSVSTIDLVPEHSTETIDFVVGSQNNKIIVVSMHDAYHVATLYDVITATTTTTVPLPGIGSIVGISSDYDHPYVYMSYSSFNDAGSIVRIDTRDGMMVTVYRAHIQSLDCDKFKVSAGKYASFDGTMVPYFLIERADASSSPCMTHMYGYGGFNIAMTPSFSASVLTVVYHLKSRYVMACIRGGGEYGEEWHKAAKRDNRDVAWRDFEYCGRHLIDQRLTTPDLLTISGGSNGGLLVAACVNRAPELYRCAVIRVGVLDLLTFHKSTVGSAWREEYGDPEILTDFNYLIKLSPLHNLPNHGIFPAILVTTGDHDDRVVPAHSFKYISELQHTLGYLGERVPFIIRIDKKAGHGGGKPTKKIIQELSDIYAFMAHTTSTQWHDE